MTVDPTEPATPTAATLHKGCISRSGSTFLEVLMSVGSQPSTKVARGCDDRAPTVTFWTAAMDVVRALLSTDRAQSTMQHKSELPGS